MDLINGNVRAAKCKINLTDSFNASLNSPCDKQVLNYSIIENCVDEDNIKLKFKISKNLFQPKVVLESLNPNVLNELLSNDEESLQINDDFDENQMDQAHNQMPSRKSSRISALQKQPREDVNLRRSSRAVSRVSYTDYNYYSRPSPYKNDFNDDYFNTTPSKKVNKGYCLDSPSKLGFENVAISTPTSKKTTKRQLTEPATKQNEGTPRKQEKNERNTKKEEKYDSVKVLPPRRMSTRNSNLTTTQKVYDDLEELLAPMINIKFDKPSENVSTPRKKKIVSNVPKTPVSQIKLLRNGDITPTMHNRLNKVVGAGTPLNVVKEKLHVSYVPKALPCRENEYSDIYNFVEAKLFDGCGGCMYISGVPGTGKTATVSEVIRQLQASSKKKKMPDFIYVSINGMRLTEPRQAYVEILKQLTGKTHGWEQAQTTLEGRFTKSKQKKETPIVLLVDELDILCTKRQDVVYNLLDWPTKAKSQLIVITIANTMDLPERLLMGRVTSRLGLTRLTFQAYTHKQLQEIVMMRLMGTNAFNPDAVQLVARKVASVSGDARRALDICRRAAEVAELEGDHVQVSMKHVDEALNSMITQPKVRAIKRCSRLEQLVLQSIAAEVERTGVDETVFGDVYNMLTSVAGIDGFRMVSITVALSAVKYLAACRLLLSDPKTCDLNQRIILNVSADDIYYALRKD